MGGTDFSRVKFNAREIALSSDAIRGEALASRELQNLLGWGSSDAGGTPFSCLLRPLTLTPVAATFTMTLADGDAFIYFPTDPSLTADDSPFEVLRWRSLAPLVFANPDGANPRIDLVVAQPASADADLTSRNILIDPVARTITAQNVFKTTNPAAIITVVTGTPGATPAPPAVPAGTVALLEVLVPAAAPSSATFGPSPRLFRRAEFPWSTASGIVAGCGLTWDLSADPAAASASVSMTGSNLVNILAIDGEVIDASAIAGVSVSQDSSNNPFGVAAGGKDKPYYFYAVGGRHSPQGTTVTGGMVPLAVVESLTPPNLGNSGRPTSAITTPRGTTTITGAVYIGLGWVVAGTTRRRACTMDGEMTHLVGGEGVGSTIAYTVTGAVVFPSIDQKPSISRYMIATMEINGSAAGDTARVVPDRGDGAGAAPGATAAARFSSLEIAAQVGGVIHFVSGRVGFNPANANLWGQFNVTGTGSVFLQPRAFEHRVPRIITG